MWGFSEKTVAFSLQQMCKVDKRGGRDKTREREREEWRKDEEGGGTLKNKCYLYHTKKKIISKRKVQK